MNGFRLVGILVSIMFLMLVVVSDVTAEAVPRLVPARCPGGVPTEVEATCYLLTVPENWEAANGRTIQLPVMVLHSRSEMPSEYPILFPTSGGPGGGSLGMASFFSQRAWLDNHTMILAEQRGTGYAVPSLACPELDNALFASFGTVLDWKSERAAELGAATACRDRLQTAGIDLAAYTTAATIQDLEALRQLLKIDQWHVYGVSYGTRLALQLAAAYPGTVRSLLLDSLYNPAASSYEAYVPSLSAVLETLFANCAADAECAAAFPDLRHHFYALVDQANATPLVADIRHSQTGQPFTVRLTGDDLVHGTFNALRNVANIPLLPLAIEQLYTGNEDALLPLAQGGFSNFFGSSRGLFYSVECSEEIPFNNMVKQQAIAAAYPGLQHFLPNPVDPAVCDIWPTVPNPEMNTAVSLSIPTLILAGEYDAITLPELAQQAQATLPNSHFYIFPTIGHAVLDVNQCANEMAVAFLANPEAEPDSSCIGQMGEINWVTEADLALTPAMYRVGTDVIQLPNYFGLAWLAITLLAFAVSLVLSTIAWKQGQTIWQLIPGMLLALAAWVTVLALGYAMLHSNQQLLGFGLPRSFGWVLWLPWVTAVSWLLLVLMGLHHRTLLNSRRFLLPVGSGLAFVIWFGWWGFFSFSNF